MDGAAAELHMKSLQPKEVNTKNSKTRPKSSVKTFLFSERSFSKTVSKKSEENPIEKSKNSIEVTYGHSAIYE